MKLSDFLREVYDFGDYKIFEVGSTDAYLLVKKINGEKYTLFIKNRCAYTIFRHYTDSFFDRFVRKTMFSFINDKYRDCWKPLSFMDQVFTERTLKKLMPVEYERIRVEEIENKRAYEKYLAELKSKAGHGEDAKDDNIFYVMESDKKEESGIN